MELFSSGLVVGYGCGDDFSIYRFDKTHVHRDDRIVGLVFKASASRAEDPGFESRLRWDFSGDSHTSDLKMALQWLPCKAPGVIGSMLGLVGPVSV